MRESDWLIRMENMLKAEMNIVKDYNNNNARQSMLMLNMFLVQIKQRKDYIIGCDDCMVLHSPEHCPSKKDTDYCKKCKGHKIRCFAEAMKYDKSNWCKCTEEDKGELE